MSTTETAASEQEQQRQISRAFLTMPQDFALTTWLHNRTPRYGETPTEIFEQAKQALPDLTRLNVDHIKTRLATFVNTLPKAPNPELTIYQRLDRLEKVVAVLCKDAVVGNLNASNRAWLADFLNEVGMA